MGTWHRKIPFLTFYENFVFDSVECFRVSSHNSIKNTIMDDMMNKQCVMTTGKVLKALLKLFFYVIFSIIFFISVAMGNDSNYYNADFLLFVVIIVLFLLAICCIYLI